MWDHLFVFDLPVANLAVRAAVVYFAILILLRISGKRQIGQMGATEFVSILLISNAVQNSMNGGDNSLIGGLLIAVVLIALTMTISYLNYKSRFCEGIFEGVPRLIIHDGKAIRKALKQEQLTDKEVLVLLRKQGVHHVSEVKNGVLEADGGLSLIRFNDLPHKN